MNRKKKRSEEGGQVERARYAKQPSGEKLVGLVMLGRERSKGVVLRRKKGEVSRKGG